MPSRFGFLEDVTAQRKLRPGVPQEQKPATQPAPLDKEVHAILGEIERAWRRDHTKIDGLVYRPGQSGIIASSTWYSWRDGTTTPDYVELRRVARAVGCDLRFFLPGEEPQRSEGANLKDETRQVIAIMEALPARERAVLRDLALSVQRTWGTSLPQDPDAERPPRDPHR